MFLHKEFIKFPDKEQCGLVYPRANGLIETMKFNYNQCLATLNIYCVKVPHSLIFLWSNGTMIHNL